MNTSMAAGLACTTRQRLRLAASAMALIAGVTWQQAGIAQVAQPQTDQGAASTQPDPGEGASGAAASQAAAKAPDAGLGDIVVTAQYRAQNLQQTPLSISAVTGVDIAARGLTNVTQLNGSIPSVVLTQSPAAFGNITQAFIRGIGQGDFFYASEPGVGMYVDDVYYGTMSGTVFDLLDLDRVEVVRGPSGTLFGKNSIGGAVRLISKKPRGDGSGFVEATYGSFNRLDVRGTFDLSLIPDKLFMRVSAVSKHQQGYQKEVDFACANPTLAGGVANTGIAGTVQIPSLTPKQPCTIGRFGGEDVKAGRVALRALVTPKLEINLTGDIELDDSPLQADSLIALDNGDGKGIYTFTNHGVVIQPYSAVPGANSAIVRSWNNVYNIPKYGIPWDQRFIAADPYRTAYQTYQTQTGLTYTKGRRLHGWGTSGTIDYDVTDNIHFKSITGFRKYHGALANDTDGSPLSIQVAEEEPASHQFTEEARFNGTLFDKRLEWTVGAFYYTAHSTLHGPGVLDFYYDNGIKGLVFQWNDTANAKSYSAFAQGIFHVTPKLELIGGYRWSYDRKDYYHDNITPVEGYPGSGFFRVSKDPACEFVINAQCPLDGPLAPQTTLSRRSDYRAGIDYHITDKAMVYGQFSTGYRAGGVNARAFSPTQVTSYGPEQAYAYEVGAKTQFFDNRVRLNGALFLTQYKNRIVNQQIIDNSGLPFTGPINIGQAVYKGAELELTVRPFGGLLINVNGSILHEHLSPQANSPAGFIDPAGTIPVGSISPGVPEKLLSIGAEYAFDLGGWGKLTPRFDWRYQSRVYTDNPNTKLQSNDPYSISNLHLAWDLPQGHWTVIFEVTNLADKKYFINKFPLLNFGLGTLEGQPAPPREYGVTLRKAF